MRWKADEEIYNFYLLSFFRFGSYHGLNVQYISAAVAAAAHFQDRSRCLGYFASNFLVRCRNEVIQDALES